MSVNDRASASDSNELQIFTVGAKSSTPISVDVLINEEQLFMEVDTGAAVSIITEQTLKAIAPDATLKSWRVVLKTYTGEQMPVLGELQVKVQYGQQSRSCHLLSSQAIGPVSLRGTGWRA